MRTASSICSGLAVCALLCLLQISHVSATHFAYGSFTWQRATGSTTTYNFRVEMSYRLSYFSNPSASVGPPATAVDVGPMSMRRLSNSGAVVAQFEVWLTTEVVYASADWFTGAFQYTYTLPDNGGGGWYLYYTMCCRISTLMDSNHDRDLTMWGLLVPSQCCSPVVTGMPREYVQQNAWIQYTVPGVSPQNYVLHYVVSQPSQSSLLYPLPLENGAGAAGAFAVNGQTGVCTWYPNTLGLYALQVYVADPYQYTPLDWIFQVVASCAAASTTCNHPPYFIPAAPFTMTFYRGVQKTYQIVSTDQDAGQTTNAFNTPMPKGATYVFDHRVGPTTYYDVTWIPAIDSVSSVVCYKAQDSLGAWSLGNYCCPMVIGVASILYISGIIRDFTKNPGQNGHTHISDMDVILPGGATSADNTVQWVSTSLGSDGTPNKLSTVTTSTVANFANWYHTDPAGAINVQQVLSLTLSNGTEPDPRIFTYFTSQFYPIDGQLWGNEGDAHNFYFTYEIHTYLTYYGGEVFNFKASDDLFFFVNQILAPGWNMQGIHPLQSFSLNMDTAAATLGITKGNTYRTDIFYACRGHQQTCGFQLELPYAVLCNALQSGYRTFTYSGYAGKTTSDFYLLGPAQVTAANIMPVNQNVVSDSGAVWWAQNGQPVLLQVLHGFETIFTFSIQNVKNGAFDGFALVIQNDGCCVRGGAGGNLGYASIKNSLAIEFDMRYNPENGDYNYVDPANGQAADHVSVHSRWTGANSASEVYSIGFSNNDPPMHMKNGSVHTVKCDYIPAQQSQALPNAPLWGWIYCWMNTVLAPVVAAQVDGRVLNTMYQGVAYIGFTSGTTDTNAADVNIASWSMVIVPASAATSGLLAQPQTIAAGTIGQVTLQLRDACGNNIITGGEASKLTASTMRKLGDSPYTLNLPPAAAPNKPITVVDNGDGTYTFSYSPTYTGTMQLNILYTNLAGQTLPVQGSPFYYQVVAAPTDAAHSPVYYSYRPGSPNNILLPVWPNYASQIPGIYVVVIDYHVQLGIPIFQKTYANTDTATFVADFAAVAAGNIVCVAVAGDAGNFFKDAGVAAAMTSLLGTNNAGTYATGNSFAAVGKKGASTGTSQLMTGQGAQAVVNFAGSPGEVPFPSFQLIVGSNGTNWGSGAFVWSIPQTYYAYAGIPSNFSIIAYDRFDNLNQGGSDPFVPSFQPDITSFGCAAAQLMSSPAYPGFYDVQWMCTHAAKYDLYVQLNGVNCKRIPLSPVYVLAGPAVAAKSSAVGTGLLQGTAGVIGTFTLTLADQYGNTAIQQSPYDTVTANLVLTSPAANVKMNLTWIPPSPIPAPPQLPLPQTLQVSYYATIAGSYQVVIMVNGNQMTQITAPCVIVAGPIWPPKCIASGAGVNSQTTGAIAGTLSQFVIQTADIFGNFRLVPVVATSNPLFAVTTNIAGQPPNGFAISYAGQGKYAFSYTPTQAAPYPPSSQPNPLGVTVMYQDGQTVLTPTQITTGIAITVWPGAAAVQSTFTTPIPATTPLVAGVAANAFTIDSIDAYGNKRFRGGEPQFYLVAMKLLGSAQGIVGNGTVLNSANDVYPVSLRSTVAGFYEIDVQLAQSGAQLTGTASPYQGTCCGFTIPGVPVEPGPTVDQAPSAACSGKGFTGGISGGQATFQITARDAYLNTQWNAYGSTTIHADTYTATITNNQNQQVVGTYPGTGSFPVHPGQTGVIYGVYDATVQVPSTPTSTSGTVVSYTLTVKNTKTGATVCTNSNYLSVSSGTTSYATVPNPPVPSPVCGVQYTETLTDWNDPTHQTPRPATGNNAGTPYTDNFNVVLYVPGSNPLVTITGQVTPPSPTTGNLFQVQFTPVGAYTNYKMNVTLNGIFDTVQTDAAGGINVPVVAGAANAAKSTITASTGVCLGLPATCPAGSTTPVGSFTVNLYDVCGLQVTAATNVYATFPTSAGINQITGVQQGTTNVYKFSYTGTTAGSYAVSINIGSPTGPLLGGSAQTLTITPGAPYAPACTATGPGLILATDGQSTYYSVTLYDKYNNLVSDGTLGAQITQTSTFTATVVLPTATTGYQGSGTYTVTYTPSTITAGQPATTPTIHVQYGGVDIKGSPFITTVQPGALKSCTVTNLASAVAGTALSFTLTCIDVNSQPWFAVTGDIFAAATDPNLNANAATVTPSTTVGGQYSVSLDPTFTTTAGIYQWQISALGQVIASTNINGWTVTGCASCTTLQQPVVPGPVFAYTTGLPPGLSAVPAGSATSVLITLKDKFGNSEPQGTTATVSFNFLVGQTYCTSFFAQGGVDVGAPAQALPVAPASAFGALSAAPVTGAAGTPQQYQLNFTPFMSGIFTLNVTINNTPFGCYELQRLNLVVNPGAPYPPNCHYSGFPPNSTAGSVLNFTVYLFDQWHNPVGKGGDNVQIGVQATAGATSTAPTPYIANGQTTGPAPASITFTNTVPALTDNGDGTYSGTYNVTMAGTWGVVITVAVSGKQNWIANGAQSTIVYAGPAAKCSFPAAPTGLMVGIPSSFQISSTDIYGNQVFTNDHTFIVQFTRAGDATVAFYTFFATVTPVAGQPGVSLVSFTSSWPGTFDVIGQLVDAAGNKPAGGYTRWSVTILPATCAAQYPNPLKAYRCPDGTCQSDYSLCTATELPCPIGQFACASTGTCVSSASACTCPTGTTQCKYTNLCVKSGDTCLLPAPCKKGQYLCATGVCRASAADCPSPKVCPPGYALCSDGVTCVSGATPGTGVWSLTIAQQNCQNSEAGYIATTSCPAGLGHCPTGECVADLASCPTAPTCGGTKVVCPDGSCKDIAAHCTQVFACLAPNSFQCPDGSCRASGADCPTHTSCPAGWTLCPNGACAHNFGECQAIVTACSVAQVQCPDGSCAPAMILCSSSTTCPPGYPVQCFDHSCAQSVGACPKPVTCPKGSLTCPDGSCVLSTQPCPSDTSCPAAYPVLCADGSCQTTLANCPAKPQACPPSAPNKCPDGSCRGLLTDCPSISACFSTAPVRCPDGSCVVAIDNCAPVPAVQCNTTQVRCPDGSCAPALSLCSTAVTCPLGYTKCLDGTCRVAPCPPITGLFNCPAGQVQCPQAGLGVSCASSLALCPQYPVCPADKPVKCVDSTCQATVAQCPPPVPPGSSYPPNSVACPDGTFKTDITQCGTAVTCPLATPYKCYDDTCRIAPTDCPKPPQCPPSTPYLCPNGKCADFLWDQAVCGSADIVCDPATPVKCPSGDCVVAVSQCPGTTDSTSCPAGWTYCRDGSCVQSAAACLPLQCPQYLPVNCSDGLCTDNAAHCNLDNGCPWFNTTKCWDGSCAASIANCPPRQPCPNGMVNCPDGSCSDTVATCPLANGCLPGFQRCLDKSCVRAPVQPTDPDLCTAGASLANACPPTTPYRCPNGYCAISSVTCPILTFKCPAAYPAQCADGSCVKNNIQCPAVFSCGVQVRCNDGSCRDSTAQCPQANTCPIDPASGAQMIRCLDTGLCAPVSVGNQYALCPNPQTGCPQSLPYKCATGQCVTAASACAVIAPNGCPLNTATTPATPQVKCWDGSCAAALTSCPSTSGCPSTTPFRCTTDGSCVADPTNCPASGTCSVLCADGSCASGPSAAGTSCKTSTGCPVTKPVRCADGTCAANSAGCSSVVACPTATPFQCVDGSCVADTKLCAPATNIPTPTGQCPTGSPVRCNSGTCTNSIVNCPQSAAVPNANTPMSGPSNECGTGVMCFDGSCQSTMAQCAQWQMIVSSGASSDTVTSCPGTGCACPAGESLCWNGYCAPSDDLCPVVPGCPYDRPWRAWNGTCTFAQPDSDPGCSACTSGQPCNYQRCEDGLCRASCHQFDGCPLSKPFHCGNRDCATDPTGCTAADVFDKSFALHNYGTADTTGVNANGYIINQTSVCYEQCMAQLKAASFDMYIDFTQTVTVPVVVANYIIEGKLIIPSGAFNQSGLLHIRPVGDSQVRNYVNRVTPSRVNDPRVYLGPSFTSAWEFQSAQSYLPYPASVLSPMINCGVDPGVAQPFNIPISYVAAIDLNRAPEYADVCLAYVFAVPDLDFYAWACIQPNALARLNFPVRTVSTNATYPVQYVEGTIGACGTNSTFAFVYIPTRAITPLGNNYYNFWAQNLIWIVLGILGFCMIVFGVVYTMKRMHRYRGKLHETRKKVDEMRQEVDEMEQFGGQAGTKDDALEMVQNPMVVQMKDLQAKLDKKNAEVQREQVKQRQMESEARQEHIVNLQGDRDALAEELERLKEEYNRQQAAKQAPRAMHRETSGSTSPASSGRTAPVRAEMSARPPKERSGRKKKELE